jgi:hypothetical protein
MCYLDLITTIKEMNAKKRTSGETKEGWRVKGKGDGEVNMIEVICMYVWN